ncbi:myosin-binding protein 2-like [Durio zibethinus]|uniref:Myosin-binding protein 2-like n=1 Tax=Durio zibethinus TaxID=66656 RepID=A0A6P6B423_DURZI|nr:myosin-binding protein 2-like [Durio zibethinus]XP_022771917.1 myosin-binding protein 2-like [Durio zibethinus]
MAAGNKFATFLHKNTSKITVILVYAVLEWILIILLLLNSLFTYLITKFANYFGLKPPCPWCSRVDHALEHGKNSNSYRDLVCDKHATEISKLSYCSSHRKLAESHLMCEECLASRPTPSDNKSIGMTRRIAFISWVTADHKLDNGEKVSPCCSCCKGSFGSKLHPPYFLFKPTWGTLDYAHKGSLIIEAVEDDASESDRCKEPSTPDSQANDEGEDMIEIKLNNEEDHNESDEEAIAEPQILSDVESFRFGEAAGEECSRSVSNSQDTYHEKDVHEDDKSSSMNITEKHFSVTSDIVKPCFAEDHQLAFINLHPQKCVSDRLFPVELIDLSTSASHCSEKQDLGKQDNENETSDSPIEETPLHAIDASAENTSPKEVESLELGAGNIKNISILHADKGRKDLVDEAREHEITTHGAMDGNYTEASATKEPNDPPAHQQDKNDLSLLVEQPQPETFLSTQDSDLPQVQESVPLLQCLQEDGFSTFKNKAKEVDASESYNAENVGANQREKSTMENKMISNDENQDGINTSLSVHLDRNEAEEEKFPDTPTSLEGMHYLHKKLLLFEKRELGTEESLDGSVVSEMESGDPILTIERLKTSLKAERKALSALYAELEEERSASAIAANQTMAMITRLQEEKAAMQMEALQYQRMMEEQSEYDQEALQLLNELMIKREKEKEELEKELEVYRKKVFDYEAKEKMRKMRRSKDGSVQSRKSSAAGSYVEDSDELSIDLNREPKDEDSSFSGHLESSDNTPADAVLNLDEMALDCVNHISALDESLTEFEDERLSILDQLKALEEKLLTMGDDQFMEDLKSIQNSFNGFDENNDLSSKEDGFSKDRSYPEDKTMASMAKSLLPFLDAADNETEEGLIYKKQGECEPDEMQKYPCPNFDLDSKKLAIEEEVDHVYERLQALEEDREFLKNCMGSIKKGDKGMDLLQEILQHLRDLRAVELRTRNMSADPQG